ncbi:glycoside hydrolase superfamily [Crucibulum laeve]|uniref:Beta-xylanase n=1 Tax=Crucibulum laeve TaxID=68775 RepID=A0A5C3M6E2_9AGAR|nr:glycoside hydrolase superfamily [Crucibulum laeve]
MLKFSLVGLLAAISGIFAQSPTWAQCGGDGWTGPTTCVDGFTCTFNNQWYSQCRPTPTSVCTTAPSSVPEPPTAKYDGLATLAKKAKKKYFGTAIDNPNLRDCAYTAKLNDTKEFNQITPGNSLKWDATEASRGTFTFLESDIAVALGVQNKQHIRGHTCVWHNQLPNWVTAGNFDNITLNSIVANHCSTVVGRYKAQIQLGHSERYKLCLYVIPPPTYPDSTELFNEDGTWRNSVFYNTTGESFVATALRAAHAADPKTKLYINDYNIEGTGPKSTAMFNLVKSLKAQRIPIHGVGLQAHLIVGQIPSTIQANIEQFAGLGVDISITELDIRMTLPVTDALLAQQKIDYQTVVSACNAVPRCIGVTIWDYTDKYSWVPSTFSGQGAALPWDENLVKKPAYDGIVTGFARPQGARP